LFFEEVFGRLNKAKVDYVVVGGVALVLHGVVRLTADLDLMIHLQRKNLEKFLDVMKDLGFKPRIPVASETILDRAERERLHKEKHMEVFSFYHPKKAISLIDVFIHEPLSYEKVKAGVKKMKVGRYSIPVVSVQDLIKLKQISDRPQDHADIQALKRIIKDEKS